MMNFALSGIAERDYLQKVRVRSSAVHPLDRDPRRKCEPTALEDDIEACEDDMERLAEDIEEQEANIEEAESAYQEALEQASAADESKDQTGGNTDNNSTGNNADFDGLDKAFDQAFQNALDGTVASDAIDQALQDAFDKALQEAPATGTDTVVRPWDDPRPPVILAGDTQGEPSPTGDPNRPLLPSEWPENQDNNWIINALKDLLYILGTALWPGRPDVLPDNARTTTNADDIFRHLEKYCDIDPNLASERLHDIKAAAGKGPADNVLFDRSGGVWDPVTRKWLGSLTAGGAKRFR